MSKEKVTIEDLARMVQKGFDSVEERLDKNDAQHQKLFNRLDKLEDNQKTIIANLENMVHKEEFEKLEQRVSKLEEIVTTVKKEGSN